MFTPQGKRINHNEPMKIMPRVEHVPMDGDELSNLVEQDQKLAAVAPAVQ